MNIYARKFLRKFASLDVTSIRMYAAALVALPIALLFPGTALANVDSSGYFALFYAAISTNILGMLLIFYIIKRFGVTVSAMA